VAGCALARAGYTGWRGTTDRRATEGHRAAEQAEQQARSAEKIRRQWRWRALLWDRLYWRQPDLQPLPLSEWRRIQGEMVHRPRWVAETGGVDGGEGVTGEGRTAVPSAATGRRRRPSAVRATRRLRPARRWGELAGLPAQGHRLLPRRRVPHRTVRRGWRLPDHPGARAAARAADDRAMGTSLLIVVVNSAAGFAAHVATPRWTTGWPPRSPLPPWPARFSPPRWPPGCPLTGCGAGSPTSSWRLQRSWWAQALLNPGASG
jgi:hypothetical protein